MQLVKAPSYIGAKAIREFVLLLQRESQDFAIQFLSEQL
jgi:hypothetical protein